MRNFFTYNIAALLLVVLVSSCCGPKETASTKETPSKNGLPARTSLPKDALTLDGTMKFIDVEGGCWQFEAANGTRYEVVGEDAGDLRHDGLQATIVVRPDASGMMSTCMVGKIVELVEIIKIMKE